jgi:hypothetical protein
MPDYLEELLKRSVEFQDKGELGGATRHLIGKAAVLKHALR